MNIQAKLSKERQTALNHELLISVRNENEAVVVYLLNEGAQVNSEEGNSTPLIEAVSNGNLHLTELLLEAGANPDLKIALPESGKKWGPLHFAVFHTKYKIVDLLINRGAKADSKELTLMIERLRNDEKISRPV